MKKPRKKVVKKKSKILLWVFGIILVMIASFMTYLFSTVTSPKIVYIPQGSVFKSISHLQKEGITSTLKDIVAIKIDDSPGGLHKAAALLAEENINIEDAYGFTIREKNQAVFVFQVADVLHTEKILKKAGFEIIYLGASVPLADLNMVHSIRPFHALFFTMVGARKKDSFLRLIQDVDQAFPDFPVFVSGLQFKEQQTTMPAGFKLCSCAESFRRSLDSLFSD